MDKFLGEVADYLLAQHGSTMENLQVVFPNRRAGLFFQKYLSERIQEPIFSPQIMTISELVGNLTRLQLADQNVLIVELYKVFLEVTGTTETLDDFYYWGEMLLADFDDLDKYLVDARQLFRNIVSLREIDHGFDYLTPEQLKYLSTFWSNILSARKSADKDQFLNIWRKLDPLYRKFRERLSEKAWAYEGMMYRNMAEQLSENPSPKEGKITALVGFNALNTCEKHLFHYLARQENALFFWDADRYYLDAPKHEAALFLHENLKQFPMPAGFEAAGNHFSNQTSIEVVAVPGFAGQATMTASWLNSLNLPEKVRFDDTAVVLCDENLLLPMLNSIPESVKSLNITMGFPIKSAPVYALLRCLIDLDRNARPGKDGQQVFYYRNVLTLFSNPLIRGVLGADMEAIVDSIRSENRIYLTAADFSNHALLSLIFKLPEQVIQCGAYLHNILKFLFEAEVHNDPLLKESIYQLYQLINRLQDSIFDNDQDAALILSRKLYYQLLLRQLDRLAIPFEGEPLEGIQLMGFLETRCLDFDHLILLSFNDAVLPGNSHRHSFIPYTLRKGFGLPVIEQRNAMYAYYFYRLIQRAKRITLVYDSRSDGLSGGEVSRYVTQLKYEAEHIDLQEKQGVFHFEPSQVQPINIVKHGGVMRKVEKMLAEKLISPSALNRYLECKLSFFFKYIEGIHEADELREEIDHLIFGRVAHKALETLYGPYVGKEMTAADIAQLLKDDRLLLQSLGKALEEEYFKKGSFDLNGKNLLVFEVLKKYLQRVMRYDQQIAPIHLLSLERKYVRTIPVEVNGRQIKVQYGGTIDRLDQVKETIRVVDYKTGMSEVKVKSIAALFEPSKNRNKAAFQTLLYASCVYDEKEMFLPLVPAVYGARSVFKEDFDPVFKMGETDVHYQANAVEFESLLVKLLEELADPAISFSQVDDVQQCKHCEFNGICNRGA
ncbi:MAG: PD-(D/E)XK nuclease family protein [Prolixibacteraceae bacterium]|nr:PD-(D/E)XK nuclease family protein [Prolixibacteraceae bacterium]